MLKKILFFIGVVGLLVLTQTISSQEHELMLDGLDGKQHSLNEYIGKGQWTVVNVWATACPYCRRELFDLVGFHEQHHEDDAMVVGLTIDLETFEAPEKEYLRNFASTYLIEYPLLLVSGEIASKVTGRTVHTVPMTFFYNPEGKLVYQFTGELDAQLLEDIIQNKFPSKG